MRLKTVALIFVLCQSIFALDFGFVFSMFDKPSVGANLKFNDLYDLRPHLEMEFGDNTHNVVIGAENNFYAPNIKSLQNYFGIDPTIVVNGGDKAHFYFRVYYGLQYAFNDVVSVFGETGLKMDVDPNLLSSFSSGVGVIFSIAKTR